MPTTVGDVEKQYLQTRLLVYYEAANDLQTLFKGRTGRTEYAAVKEPFGQPIDLPRSQDEADKVDVYIYTRDDGSGHSVQIAGDSDAETRRLRDERKEGVETRLIIRNPAAPDTAQYIVVRDTPALDAWYKYAYNGMQFDNDFAPPANWFDKPRRLRRIRTAAGTIPASTADLRIIVQEYLETRRWATDPAIDGIVGGPITTATAETLLLLSEQFLYHREGVDEDVVQYAFVRNQEDAARAMVMKRKSTCFEVDVRARQTYPFPVHTYLLVRMLFKHAFQSTTDIRVRDVSGLSDLVSEFNVATLGCKRTRFRDARECTMAKMASLRPRLEGLVDTEDKWLQERFRLANTTLQTQLASLYPYLGTEPPEVCAQLWFDVLQQERIRRDTEMRSASVFVIDENGNRTDAASDNTSDLPTVAPRHCRVTIKETLRNIIIDNATIEYEQSTAKRGFRQTEYTSDRTHQFLDFAHFESLIFDDPIFNHTPIFEHTTDGTRRDHNQRFIDKLSYLLDAAVCVMKRADAGGEYTRTDVSLPNRPWYFPSRRAYVEMRIVCLLESKPGSFERLQLDFSGRKRLPLSAMHFKTPLRHLFETVSAFANLSLRHQAASTPAVRPDVVRYVRVDDREINDIRHGFETSRWKRVNDEEFTREYHQHTANLHQRVPKREDTVPNAVDQPWIKVNDKIRVWRQGEGYVPVVDTQRPITHGQRRFDELGAGKYPHLASYYRRCVVGRNASNVRVSFVASALRTFASDESLNAMPHDSTHRKTYLVELSGLLFHLREHEMRNVHMHTPFSPKIDTMWWKWIPVPLNDGDVTPFVHDHVRLVVVGKEQFQIHDFQEWFFKQDDGKRHRIWMSLSCEEDDLVWRLDDAGGEYDIEHSCCLWSAYRNNIPDGAPEHHFMYSNTDALYRRHDMGSYEFHKRKVFEHYNVAAQGMQQLTPETYNKDPMYMKIESRTTRTTAALLRRDDADARNSVQRVDGLCHPVHIVRGVLAFVVLSPFDDDYRAVDEVFKTLCRQCNCLLLLGSEFHKGVAPRLVRRGYALRNFFLDKSRCTVACRGRHDVKISRSNATLPSSRLLHATILEIDAVRYYVITQKGGEVGLPVCTWTNLRDAVFNADKSASEVVLLVHADVVGAETGVFPLLPHLDRLKETVVGRHAFRTAVYKCTGIGADEASLVVAGGTLNEIELKKRHLEKEFDNVKPFLVRYVREKVAHYDSQYQDASRSASLPVMAYANAPIAIAELDDILEEKHRLHTLRFLLNDIASSWTFRSKLEQSIEAFITKMHTVVDTTFDALRNDGILTDPKFSDYNIVSRMIYHARASTENPIQFSHKPTTSSPYWDAKMTPFWDGIVTAMSGKSNLEELLHAVEGECQSQISASAPADEDVYTAASEVVIQTIRRYVDTQDDRTVRPGTVDLIKGRLRPFAAITFDDDADATPFVEAAKNVHKLNADSDTNLNITFVKPIHDAIKKLDLKPWDTIRRTRNVILACYAVEKGAAEAASGTAEAATSTAGAKKKLAIRAALLADVEADIESVYKSAEKPKGDDSGDVDLKVPTALPLPTPDSFREWLKHTLGCVVHPSHLLVQRTQKSLYAKLAFAFNETYRHHVRMSRYVYATVGRETNADKILEDLLRQCPEVSCVRIVCIQTDADVDVRQYVVPNPDFAHLHTDVSLKAKLKQPLRATDARATIDVGTEHHHFPTEGVAYFRIQLDDAQLTEARNESENAVNNVRNDPILTSGALTDALGLLNYIQGLVQTQIDTTAPGTVKRLAVETAVREIEKRAERASFDGKNADEIKTFIDDPSGGEGGDDGEGDDGDGGDGGGEGGDDGEGGDGDGGDGGGIVDHPKAARNAALGPEYIYAELEAHKTDSSLRYLKIKSRGVGQTFIPESRPSAVSTVEVSTFFSPIEIVLVLDQETGALLPTRPHQR